MASTHTSPAAPAGRRTGIITPVEVSLWVSAYRSTAGSGRGCGWLPGGLEIRSGGSRCGAAAAAANLPENSPNTRCWLRRWIPATLSLATALEQSRADQTLNTPALATLFLLAHQVDWLNAQGGLAWATKRCDESAGIVYGWAEASGYATPFVADPAMRSHTVATVDLDPSVDAAAISRALRANGIVDTEPYRKLGRNQLRIGMYPAVDPADLETLTRAIDWLVAA